MNLLNRLTLTMVLGLTVFPFLGAQAANPAPATGSVSVNIVTFDVRNQGEKQRLVVTTSPTLLRLDKPDDGLSIIYDPQSQHYTGLEHRNDTWWEFSWPAVQAAVQTSKRYESHLRDLTVAGLNDYQQQPATNAAPATATTDSIAATGDDSGYVWRETADKKQIAGYDCLRWTGETVSGGETVEAWCYAGPLPQIQAALEQLRVINEPMALVPVREVVPPFIFIVYDSLHKGGVTPLLINWGSGERDRNTFAFIQSQARTANAALFSVPPVYMKTTLITMDGMLDEKK